MAGLNKVQIIGNLGADPDIKRLQDNTTVARFSVATSESYKDKQSGEIKTSVEWHNIVVWRNLAEIVEKYLKKGSQVYIEGKLKTNKWTDKDGITRYTTEIIASTMQMLGGATNNSTATTNNNNTNPANQSPQEDEDDDLPF